MSKLKFAMVVAGAAVFLGGPVRPSVAAPEPQSTFKPGVMLQAWYSGSDAGDGSNSFRIRRAEVSGKGEIVPDQIAYGVMFDVARLLEFQDKSLSVGGGGANGAGATSAGTVTAKQPAGGSSVLQDVFITYLTAVGDIAIGQFKNPVSYEGFNSSSKLLFPERAMVASAFGDRRDPGMRIAKQFQYAGYTATLQNGSGQNALDSNRGKDGAVRLELYPTSGLMLAGVASGTLWRRRDPGSKDRFEADLRFTAGPFLLQGEYIYGRDHTQSAGAKRWETGQGFYTAAAVHVAESLQIATRVGVLDPNTDKTGDHSSAYEGTLNWYVRKFEARAQMSFSHFRRKGGDQSDNTVILAAQTSY